jgi:hypothetical protein
VDILHAGHGDVVWESSAERLIMWTESVLISMGVSQRIRRIARENGYKVRPLRSRPYSPKLTINSYIVQTLTRPKSKSARVTQKHNPWGAGNSGLSPRDLARLNKIVMFEPMGYAEYEMGDLGLSYRRIKVNIHRCSNFSFNVAGFDFYVICYSGHRQAVEKNIKKMLVNDQFNSHSMLKQPLHLSRHLTSATTNFVGGWDILNDFVFFTKKGIFREFRKLLLRDPEVYMVKRLLFP